MDIRKLLNSEIVLLDGAMGTMLQPDFLKAGEIPELLNLTNPGIIEAVHKAYINSGAQIIYTNTFGANRKKIPEEYSPKQIIPAAIDVAKQAVKNTNCLIAYDMGPIGQLLEPLGTLSFEEAYDIFAEQVKLAYAYGADLIVIETVADLYEMKAAVLAVKENSPLPVIATMTYEKTMRTFMGCDLRSMAVTLEGLGVDAIGINCSLAPCDLLPHVEELLKYTSLPVVVKANAGLPDVDGNFSSDVTSFFESYEKFVEMGVSVIGGCCGTNPEYIKALSKFKGRKKKTVEINILSCVCTASNFVPISGVKVIGERLNPTGKKLMKSALIENNFDYIQNQALEQIEAGANILDINCGLPEIDETIIMPRLIKKLQSIIDVPLQIDSANPVAIEKALRVYNGKAIVNSVNGDDETLETILPIVKKYGAAVVGLTLDKKGIPPTTADRIKIAEKIIEKAKAFGIPSRDIFIDPLTLTVSAEPLQAKNTLEALRYIHYEMGYNTVLGISNVSFGLPNRQLLNSNFLACALNSGLTLPIINPNIPENMDAIRCYNVLNGNDEGCNDYISHYTAKVNITSNIKADKDLEYCIMHGLKEECAVLTKKLLESTAPMEIISSFLIPALDNVGILYEQGKLFLPQLILCAETAKFGFNEINQFLSITKTSIKKEKILLATVKGDIHDIGKNIVKVVLENYGYKIIDLGKNVDISEIISTIKAEDIKLIGLSALMTTTAANMEKTIEEIRKQNLPCKIMVGGAVITEDYAKKIGADFYSKDANEAVKIAKSFQF